MKHLSACTTILVGKKASIDGSVMISRNDDTAGAITPQKFIIEPHANKQLEILRFIYDTVEERAFPPTVREICSY